MFVKFVQNKLQRLWLFAWFLVQVQVVPSSHWLEGLQLPVWSMAEESAALKKPCRRKTLCAVCRLAVIDGKDEAILCEGKCQQWYHRGCASLPPERYKELSTSDEPFYCLTCTCLAFKEEYSALTSIVSNLREELRVALSMQDTVSTLKAEVVSLNDSQQCSAKIGRRETALEPAPFVRRRYEVEPLALV